MDGPQRARRTLGSTSAHNMVHAVLTRAGGLGLRQASAERAERRKLEEARGVERESASEKPQTHVAWRPRESYKTIQPHPLTLEPNKTGRRLAEASRATPSISTPIGMGMSQCSAHLFCVGGDLLCRQRTRATSKRKSDVRDRERAENAAQTASATSCLPGIDALRGDAGLSRQLARRTAQPLAHEVSCQDTTDMHGCRRLDFEPAGITRRGNFPCNSPARRNALEPKWIGRRNAAHTTRLGSGASPAYIDPRRIGPHLPEQTQARPKWAQIWSNLADVMPNFVAVVGARFGPEVGSGPHSAEVGPVELVPLLDLNRPLSAQFRQKTIVESETSHARRSVTSVDQHRIFG